MWYNIKRIALLRLLHEDASLAKREENRHDTLRETKYHIWKHTCSSPQLTSRHTSQYASLYKSEGRESKLTCLLPPELKKARQKKAPPHSGPLSRRAPPCASLRCELRLLSASSASPRSSSRFCARCGLSEEEAEDRKGEGSEEEEGAGMMGQVWNLHTPLAWLISARLGSVTHDLLVEVRENVGDRRSKWASACATVYSPRPKCCSGGSERG